MNKQHNGRIMNAKHLWKNFLCAALAAVMGFSVPGAALAQTGTVTFYHNDALGSPVAATDAGGDVIWRKTYDPYGREFINGGSAAASNNIGYTGHLFDNDLGLVYAGARYYDPEIGRFMSVDPVEFQEGSIQSFNKYAYAINNPYMYIDPNGERPVGFSTGFMFNWGIIEGRIFELGPKGAVGGIVAFDTETYEIAVVTNWDLGLGFTTSDGVGIYANALWGEPKATLDDLSGPGLVASASGALKTRTAPNGVNVSIAQPLSRDMRYDGITEVGLTISTPGAEFGGAFSKGKERFRFTFIRDAVDTFCSTFGGCGDGAEAEK